MKQEIGQLSKHTLIYGIGIIASKAASFIMLPVYTRYLSPADYGVLELLITTVEVIAMIVGMGLTSAVFKFYVQYEDPNEKKEVISTVLILMIAVSLITTTMGILFAPSLSQLVFGQSGHRYYFQLAFMIYFLQSGIVTIPLLFIRAMQNSTLFVLLNFIKLALQLSLNIYFLTFLEMGVAGVLYSSILSEFLLGLYLIIRTFSQVGFGFSASKSKSMIEFGFPLIFVFLSSFVLTFSDRYFLNAYTTLETVGIYALAYKFGFILTTLTYAPFSMIWEPQRFEIAKQENAGMIFRKVFFYINLGIVSLSLLICLFVKDMLTVMSAPSYLDAYKLVPIIIVAYAVQAWTSYCNLGLFLKGKSNYMAVSAMIAAVSLVGLNFILVPLYGTFGAAWATVGAFFLRFILVYKFSQRFYRIVYGWDRHLWLMTIAVAIYLASRTLAISSVPASLAINSGLMLLFLIVVYAVCLDKDEKSFIKSFVRHYGLRRAAYPYH